MGLERASVVNTILESKGKLQAISSTNAWPKVVMHGPKWSCMAQSGHASEMGEQAKAFNIDEMSALRGFPLVMEVLKGWVIIKLLSSHLSR